jgi:uroporphyrinogen III methyltransferase / synthase
MTGLMRLQGLKIVVTRSRSQAKDLSEKLTAEGAIVYDIPAIQIVENPEGMRLLRHELTRISHYSWLLLTSVNTVLLLDKVLMESGKNWTIFESLRIACIGTSTAAKVTERGANVDFIPPEFRAESLASELIKRNVKGQTILLPRAAGSRPVLPERLIEAGATVQEIHLYRAELPEQNGNDVVELFDAERHPDFLTFTSSSTVRNFAELAGDLPWQKIPAACIGPVTAETLREYGVEATIQAEEFTIEGLVEAIIRCVRK